MPEASQAKENENLKENERKYKKLFRRKKREDLKKRLLNNQVKIVNILHNDQTLDLMRETFTDVLFCHNLF